MAAIFADTAQTTLVEQNRGVVPGDVATQAMAQADPMSIFGEDNIDKWNAAAFAPARPGAISLPRSVIDSIIKGE